MARGRKQTIAVDFDGVIHRYSRGWQDGSIYDPPVDGAVEALERLHHRYKVVIFTTRVNPEMRNGNEQKDRVLELAEGARVSRRHPLRRGHARQAASRCLYR